VTAPLPARSEPIEDDPEARVVSLGEDEHAEVVSPPIPRTPVKGRPPKKSRPLRVTGDPVPEARTPPVPANVYPAPPPLPAETNVGPAAPAIVVPPKPPLPASVAAAAAPLVQPDREDLAVVAEPQNDDLPVVAEPNDHDAAETLAVALSNDRAEPQATSSITALAVRGLTKRFGETIAVDGIDLTVPAGTFYGVVGPNGAGKTTTLSMVSGLLRPDRGHIEVCGVDAARDPVAAKRLMGVLPDRFHTFDRLTGRQLLYYYGVLRGLRPAVVESRTADLARAFDLTDALGRVVSDYSAGMTKKVMLAGAMIHSPRLLVLDEPFEAVDPVSSAIILDILGTYVAHGGTVILSSHGMDLVERVCSRVAVIVAGQALAEGTLAEVRGELTLEQRFIELAGGLSDVEGLEWLHTFSD